MLKLVQKDTFRKRGAESDILDLDRFASILLKLPYMKTIGKMRGYNASEGSFERNLFFIVPDLHGSIPGFLKTFTTG